VVAFDAATGEKLWELNGHPSTYSSPILMKLGKEKLLVVQTETDLIGVSMDGHLLWKFATPGERRFYNSSTPVINGQNIIIAGQGLGTKSLKVEKNGGSYTLTEVWSNPDYGASFNTPVLKDGFLYGHEARMGKIYCLNATTGETAWADTVSHNRFASNLDIGKEILSLTARGELLVYAPSSEKYTELAVYPVVKTDVYAHPVVAGNKIYIKDKENLTCWEVN
jgi:outer membrane protein assembly factor BamB